MATPQIAKIVSGGQTGVDRAALDVAIFLEIPHGGWCPRGRRAEDGEISNVYQLTETPSANYTVRTEKNVVDSDGTLIIFRQAMTRGTGLTASFARRHNRPCLTIDVTPMEDADDEDWINTTVEEIHSWLASENVLVLNVAGPRASTSAGIANQAHTLLLNTLAEVNVI